MGVLTWLATIVGPKAAKPVLIGVVILLLFGAGFTLAKCTGGNDGEAEQAEQTSRSSEAMANAAQNAIERIDNRTVTEDAIDAATANALEEINNASNPDDMRNAVLDGVCGQSSHRNDPACKMR